MDDPEDILNSSSTKSNKMENTPKVSNNGSKVKLKVIKRKVNIRRKNRFNRSNTSFNTSLNTSTLMKKTLVANNQALADAVQISKHEFALSTEMITSLQKDNIDLMIENGEIKHNLSQAIDDQVNDRLKPLLKMFKSKVCEVGIHLADVASAIKDLSVSVGSQLALSNANSRANSLEINQNLTNVEFIKMPQTEKEQKSSCDFPSLKHNSFNLSLIAESSYLNLDRSSSESFNILDMVPENEPENFQTKSDIKSVPEDKNPQGLSMETRGSWLRRDSMNRRKSMDEIDFGPHVAKSRKLRRSSFFLPAPTGREKPLCPNPKTPLKNEEAKSYGEEQDDDVYKTVKTTQLPSPTLIDDDAIVLIDLPLDIKSVMEVDAVYKDLEEDLEPELPAASELSILMTSPEKPVQREEDIAPVDDATVLIDLPLDIKYDMEVYKPAIKSVMEVDAVYKDLEEDLEPELPAASELSILMTSPEKPVQREEDIAPVVNNPSPMTTHTLPLTDTEGINHTNVNEIDMELTEVIDASVYLDTEAHPLPAVPSTDEAKKSAPAEALGTMENEQNAAFLKPIQITKMKTQSMKDKKAPKKAKEKTKETSVDDDGKAVVELKLMKPGKIVFSAMRKNIAGIRPSPPKARSKKIMAAMKKNELAAEPKNLFDFHDKTPQLLAKKPEVAAHTGIYDVSLNDSVYGPCQSLGEYRERVAMAKRIDPVNGTDVPSNSISAVVSEKLLETAAKAVPEEKKNRSRSKRAVDEDKRGGRSRSRKRVEESDSDSDTDTGKWYKKMARSIIDTDVPDRQPTHRARSKKVVSYKEVESDFDMTLMENVAPVVPLKNVVEKEKEASSADDDAKEPEPKTVNVLNSQEIESKKETVHKNLKGTSEKRARSRKRSTVEVKTIESSDNPTLEGAENPVPKKVPVQLINLMSRLEKLQRKESHSQHKPEEESQDPSETISKPKSIPEDKAVATSRDGDHRGKCRGRECSRSRSRPARDESAETMTSQILTCGSSRSLRVRKSSGADDTVKIMPERRSRSVAKKEHKSHGSNGADGKVSSMAEKNCSQSVARTELKSDELEGVDDNVKPTPEKKRTRSIATKKPKSDESSEGVDDYVKHTHENKRAQSVTTKKSDESEGMDNHVNPTPEKTRTRSVSTKKPKSGESEVVDAIVNPTREKKRAQSVATKELMPNKSNDMNDEVKSMPTKKPSQSVGKRVNATSPPPSTLKKRAESPEAGKSHKIERGRSKSRVGNDTRLKAPVPGVRTSSAEKKKPEGSPETLQRKIRKERGRSKVALIKNDDFDGGDDKVAPSVDKEVVNSEMNSHHTKTIEFTLIGKKSKSSVADKENINTNVKISNMDAIRKSAVSCQPESSHKEVKSSSGLSYRVSGSLRLSSTDAEDKTLSMFPRISCEKYPGKRSAEFATTDENQDLKRPRRSTKQVSYKELSIGKKLRQGDSFFSSVGHINTGKDEEARKRSILENVTNLNR